MIFFCRGSVTSKCLSNGCGRQASLYCEEYADYFCGKCAVECSVSLTSLNFHPVKQSHWNNSMFPYCKDHDSFETMFCLNCEKLCCKYCKHEFHKEHGTMILEDYNKAKYEETVSKEMQKLRDSMIKCEKIRKNFDSRIANQKRMEADFFNSLAERKNILIAKCIDMICDIEKKYKENYCKMKSKHDEELLKKLTACDHVMVECSNIFDQKEKYSKGNSVEKFYSLNQLVVNIKKCNKSFNKVDPKLEFSMNFDHSHDNGNEWLFYCLSESFGVSLTLSGTCSENSDDLMKVFTYNPSQSFKNTLKNNEEVCSFIKRMLNVELNHLNIVGKNCDRLLCVTYEGVVNEKCL